MPYGKRSEVEILLRDMESQKFLLEMTKGDEKVGRWIQGVIRLLPFGVYEYIFPKENMDAVLTTLGFHGKNYPNLSKFRLAFLRKALDVKKAPPFKAEQKYLWVRDFVSILPIGIREDGEITEPDGEHKGFTHEAL